MLLKLPFFWNRQQYFSALIFCESRLVIALEIVEVYITWYCRHLPYQDLELEIPSRLTRAGSATHRLHVGSGYPASCLSRSSVSRCMGKDTRTRLLILPSELQQLPKRQISREFNWEIIILKLETSISWVGRWHTMLDRCKKKSLTVATSIYSVNYSAVLLPSFFKRKKNKS